MRQHYDFPTMKGEKNPYVKDPRLPFDPVHSGW